MSIGGSISAGNGETYGVSFVRAARSAFARATSVSSRIASIAVPAITLATCTMPLCAASVLPCAVSCQEWPGVPIA